jgi:prepilin-type N-terminal cleavage/methylation domain-containing protein
MFGRPLRKSEPASVPRGFTLIELLVVIGIIALLISILVPVLSKAKIYSKRVVCLGNLKQWAVVLDLYIGDNEGRFFAGPLDSTWDDWVEVLRPYCSGRESISCCPFAKKTRAQGGEGIFAAWNDTEGDYGSYGLNAWVCDSEHGGIFERTAYWKTPGQHGADNIPVFLDCVAVTGWPDANSVPPAFDGEGPGADTLEEQMKNFCIDRHMNGTTNCLFMDWSARAVGLKELWKLKWHQHFNTAGPWTRAGGVTGTAWPQWMRGFKNY